MHLFEIIEDLFSRPLISAGNVPAYKELLRDNMRAELLRFIRALDDAKDNQILNDVQHEDIRSKLQKVAESNNADPMDVRKIFDALNDFYGAFSAHWQLMLSADPGGYRIEELFEQLQNLESVTTYKEHLKKKLQEEISSFEAILAKAKEEGKVEGEEYSKINLQLNELINSVNSESIDFTKVSADLKSFVDSCEKTGLWQQNDKASASFKMDVQNIILSVTMLNITFIATLATIAVVAGLITGTPLLIPLQGALFVLLAVWGMAGVSVAALTLPAACVAGMEKVESIKANMANGKSWNEQPADSADFNSSVARISRRGQRLTTFFKEEAEAEQAEKMSPANNSSLFTQCFKF